MIKKTTTTAAVAACSKSLDRSDREVFKIKENRKEEKKIVAVTIKLYVN